MDVRMDTGQDPEIAPVAAPPRQISRNFTTLLALNRIRQQQKGHIYDGSVADATVAGRRARNRRARISRRKNRSQK